MTIEKTVGKYKMGEEPSDLKYWQSRSPKERLEALEHIRQDFNRWKYGAEQRIQRVYRIIKQK